MPVRYSVEGNQGGIGVDDAGYAGSGYPFLRYQDASEYLLDLHISSELPAVEQLRLVAVYSERIADLVFTDDDQLTIDTRQMDLSYRNWQGPIWVCRWSAGRTVIQAVIKQTIESLPGECSPPLVGSAVVGSAFVGCGATQTFGDNAWLDPRTLCFRPPTVRDLLVKQGDQWVSALRSDRTVKIKAGYNMRYTAENQISGRGERLSNLMLDAVPGAGLGKLPSCDVNLGLTALGNASPTPVGDLLLSGDDCLSITPELTFTTSSATVSTGRFVVRDDCEARCQCSDFAAVANYAIATWNKFKVLADRAKSLRDSYHDLRAELKTWLDCSQANPLKLNVWRSPPCGIGLGIGISNVTDVCLTGLSLSLSLVNPDGDPLPGGIAPRNGVLAVKYTGQQAYLVPGDYTVDGDSAVFALDPIKPGQMGFVYLRFELPTDSCDATGTAELSLVGDLPAGQNPIDPIQMNF